MIIPYALMMDDPTTSVMVCWIDERSEADGFNHTLYYGDQITIVGPWETLANGDYIYRADLSGLDPGTEYPLSIDVGGGPQDIPPVRTLPARIPMSGIKILSLSDTHSNKRQMTNPSQFSPMANEQVDIMFVSGDLLGENDYSKSSSNADSWKIGMRDYVTQINKDYMPHILLIPGNHEVGNTRSDGISTGDETGTQFRQFFPNVYEVTPSNTNHAAIKIGDYLQFLGGDCYSNTAASVGQMIEDYHDPDVALCIYGAHSPMFSADDMRFPEDNEIQERMRNACFYRLASKENVYFAHGGNIHIRSVTWPLKFVDEDPQTSDSFPVSGDKPGWIVRADDDDEDVLLEFGQGWIDNRPGTLGWWFFEHDARGEQHHHIIEVMPGSVRQRTISQNLFVYDDRSWMLPRSRRLFDIVYVFRHPKRLKGGTWKRSVHRRVAGGAWQ